MKSRDKSMNDDLVREFYTSHVRGEWQRLVRNPYHRLEFETTLHFLNKYLPERGLILDAGGGPGRFTMEMAKSGYDVVLLDLTQANLDFAARQVKRQKLQAHVKQITAGSIVDLSRFHDDTFDGVLCSGGPLSHILDPKLREQAISELVRVVKPASPILVSVIGRFGVFLEIMIYGPEELEIPEFKLLRDTGDYLGGRGFTACHFFLADEFREVFTRADIQILEMAGLEGISTQHVKAVNRLAKDEKLYKLWLETHLHTCTIPAAVGMSEHMLIVCRKR